MMRILLLSLVIAFAISGSGIAATQAETGDTLLKNRCSVCHSPARAESAQKTRDQWETTVTRMIGKGAQLSSDEKATLVDYLSKTYKPKSRKSLKDQSRAD